MAAEPTPDRHADARPEHPALTTVLGDGDFEITGRLTQASNATFVGQLRGEDGDVQCVYKPIRGERPLWDFPRHTLAFREVAAYRISRLGGFDVVPVTVLADGPAGTGSLQVWVEEDEDPAHPLVDLVPTKKLPRKGYFDVVEGLDRYDSSVSVIHADHPLLRSMAVFDALVNNADRKGGHIIGSEGRVFGVDHGICFHTEDKLRTILWGWAGSPLDEADIAHICAVQEGAIDEIADLLSDDEIEALLLRAEGLLAAGELPLPGGGWPNIPWPPF
ncbi:putative repeat protein (TIGR03843 family) [Friedmanniella endophytica]|uniref:Putative repeat protein (TIGR03843 family) n=1 Tax=Microlunatus kandeliicorticis TaxID=1759536 RepID=A0A7W3IUE8_9ACTN|nr:SCO1664 family protein [Microlunatus kandeliicorticis]MBA8795310.1 putative repeat protein (TIGR03843 family) [Microlunatus kandeliicorticis]